MRATFFLSVAVLVLQLGATRFSLAQDASIDTTQDAKSIVPDGPLVSGTGQYAIEMDGTILDVFTYKPVNFDGKRMIMVMHGVNRNADEYRDHSKRWATDSMH